MSLAGQTQFGPGSMQTYCNSKVAAYNIGPMGLRAVILDVESTVYTNTNGSVVLARIPQLLHWWGILSIPTMATNSATLE